MLTPNIMLEGKMFSGIRVKEQSIAEAKKMGAVLSIMPFGKSLWGEPTPEQHRDFLLERDRWEDD